MRINRYEVFLGILALVLLVQTAVQAQTAAGNRFIEVVDAAGKPVADATVETFQGSSEPQSSQQTDKFGKQKFLIYFGDVGTSSFKVSKPGYVAYEDYTCTLYPNCELAEGEIANFNPERLIRIKLLKISAIPAERAAVEAEQQKREFLLAVKRADYRTVRRLLQAEVDANTRDADGIPAILWATTTGNVDLIQLLLGNNADVRSKDKSGRKALLYYLIYRRKVACGTSLELVQRLIECGADVNAVARNGATVLMLAQQLCEGCNRIIKVVERAEEQLKP